MRAVIIHMSLAVAALAGCATESPRPPAAGPAEIAAPPTAAEPVAAAQPVPEEAIAAQAAVVDTATAAGDDEVVCRNEKLLGTRISKRICKTKDQRRAEEAAAREMMKNRDRKSHGVTDPLTGGG